MKRFACGMAVTAFLLTSTPSPGWSQQLYLYSPTAVESAGTIQGKDGILVQDVSIRKGDTLSGISRKFSGRGSFYPQILLFNEIKNPNRIYPGEVFKIPVSKKSAVTGVHKSTSANEKPAPVVREASVPAGAEAPPAPKAVPAALPVTAAPETRAQDVKKTDVSREKKRGAKEKVASASKKQVSGEKQQGAAGTSSGQKLFENAVKAYRQDDCKTALELFDKYLADNQTSPLAADASLYKAECYLKLSK